jgi:anti-sigma-K factor RskA
MSNTEPIVDPLDALCAEYALGLLQGVDLMAFEKRLAQDRALAQRVAAWEERLGTMPVPTVVPISPPSLKWEDVERRVFAQRAHAEVSNAVAAHNDTSARWWKWLSTGLATVCVVTIGALAWTLHHDRAATVVAHADIPSHAQCYVVLTDSAGTPRLVVYDENAMRTLNVLPVGDGLTTVGSQPTLWIVSDEGAVALGTLNTSAKTLLQLQKPQMSALMARNARMVVHSNTEAPTGDDAQGYRFSGSIALLPTTGT